MTAETPNLQAITGRLERLERQNRRLKRAAIAAVAAFGAAFVMGATSPVPSTVTARQFILVDENGKRRGSFDVTPSGSQIRLFNANGEYRGGMHVDNDNVSIGLGTAKAQGAPSGLLAARLNLGVVNDIPEILMLDTDGNMAAGMGVDPNGPNVSLWDKEGYSTVIGNAELVTPSSGETHHTSAAAIVMFGKGNKVIWKAPEP